jgi:UDP-N-acetylmuramoyl-tripeptide--D-alanyl-D-alanine ligase
VSFTAQQLAQYVDGELHGDSSVLCCGAEIDTRRSLLGKIFFALQGENTDGHEYVEEAVLGGCSAVVVEKHFNLPVPVVIVEDAREALFKLAKARREEITFDSVIAVTGSVGKTTTKDILSTLLGKGAVVSRKSFNNDLGVPLTILDAEQANYLVSEIGANALGEIEPLANLVNPDIAILTSVEKAHLEGFGTIEIVLKEKSKLLSSVHEGGYVIVPDTIDVSAFSFMGKVIKVGKSDSADIKILTGLSEDGFATLEMEGRRVSLSLLGEHNAMNAALAIVASSFAMREKSIWDLLELASKVCSPEGRLRKIEAGGVTFIDDSYNANPASMRAALKLFSTFNAPRKILVLGDMLELGETSKEEHRSLGPVIEQVGVDLVVLVGSGMGSVVGDFSAIRIPDATNLDKVTSLLQQDDLVLLKGSRDLRLERIIGFYQQTKVLEH